VWLLRYRAATEWWDRPTLQIMAICKSSSFYHRTISHWAPTRKLLSGEAEGLDQLLRGRRIEREVEVIQLDRAKCIMQTKNRGGRERWCVRIVTSEQRWVKVELGLDKNG